MSTIPTRLRRALYERDGGLCQRCGRHCLGGWFSLHHRDPRGMGGTTRPDEASNLVLVCGSGTSGCHGWIETHRTQAKAEGWLLRSYQIPAVTPLLRFGRVWAIPTLTGWTPATAPVEEPCPTTC